MFAFKMKGYTFKKRTAVYASLIFFGLLRFSYFMGTKQRVDVSHEPFDSSRLQNITECGCTRKFFYKAPAIHSKRLNSSCSDEGSFYQKNQGVVSISFTIKDPNDTSRIVEYKEGLTENLKRMKEYYPRNTMRIYTDMDLEPGSHYCQLLCANPELHWCDVRKTPSLGDQSEMFFMTWRFLTLGDPTVDYFLSRDLDSVILERQVGAVREWLRSIKAFHSMRDKYPEHNIPMLGGLWGARNSILGMNASESLRNQIIQLSKEPPKNKGRDQDIINQLIFYPMGRRKMVVFDSYFCKRYRKYTEVRPFPVKRKDITYDFAGNVHLGRQEFKLTKCPVACRPEYGKDWEYC